MEEMELEKRMYFFVPYNISPIQQAIQAGHAALEYAHKFGHHTEYINFIEQWKTWIILNGGTTNEKRDFDGISQGSLNQIRDNLATNGINSAQFHEPDLNDALTAVCFIADERVWNHEKYLDFDTWFCTQHFPDGTKEWEASYMAYDEGARAKAFPRQYKAWLEEVMGSEKNVFLRELLRGKKLA